MKNQFSKISDPETREKLIKGIQLGMSFVDAASFAGITRQTFWHWRKKAEKAPKGKYAGFFEELHKAMVSGKAIHLNNIRVAGSNGQWQASAWLLERRYPGEFGLLKRTEDQDKEKPQPVTVIIQPQDCSKKVGDGSEKE